MSKDQKTFVHGIKLPDIQDRLACCTEPCLAACTCTENEGRTYVYAGKLKIYLEAAIREVITTTQAQTLTQKTISGGTVCLATINTNDEDLTIQDSGCATKKAKFLIDSAQCMCSTISVTLPNVSGTILTDSGTATLTNKTIVAACNTITTAVAPCLVATELNAALAELQADILTRFDADSDVCHDCTTGFVANEHINHSCVSVTAGAGLTGGGDITSTKTIDVIGTANEITVSACAVGISDNPILPGTGSVTLPIGTTAQQPCCGVDGMFRYNSTNSVFEGFSSCAWGEIGGGSGGLDIFYTETFEITKAACFCSGNNACFQGGGCLVGTLADETCSPISGDSSLKYTQTACSINDWISSGLIPIDLKQQSNTNGMEFYFSYTGADDDIKIVVWDDTCCQILTSATDFFKATSSTKRFSVQFPTGSSAANLRWGYQVVSATACAVLTIDDVQLTTSPYVSKELLETPVVVKGEGSSGAAITANTENIDFTVLSDPLGLWTQTGPNGDDTFTAPSDGEYLVTGAINATANIASWRIDAYVDCVKKNPIAGNVDTVNQNTLSGTITLISGEELTFRSSDTFTQSNNENHHISIIKIPEASCQIIAYNPRTASNLVVEGAGNGGTSITAFVTDLDWTEVTDTGFGCANWDGSTFTAPEDGIYSITGGVKLSSGIAQSVLLYINGCQTDEIGGDTVSAATGHTFSTTKSLSKNDTINVRLSQNTTLTNSTTSHTISITKIGTGDLLGVPFTKFQTKYLCGSIVANTCCITDLKFCNLEPCQFYKLTVQAALNTQVTAATATITANNNCVVILRLTEDREASSSATAAIVAGSSRIFKAGASAVTFSFTETTDGQVTGNNTAEQTFATLEELPLHKETTEWD